MRTVKFTSWQDDTFFIGFLNEYPEYQTQGMTKDELIENLKDLLQSPKLIKRHVNECNKSEPSQAGWGYVT